MGVKLTHLFRLKIVTVRQITANDEVQITGKTNLAKQYNKIIFV